jgi:hypothetical protein
LNTSKLGIWKNKNVYLKIYTGKRKMSLQKNLFQVVENSLNSYIEILASKFTLDRAELQNIWAGVSGGTVSAGPTIAGPASLTTIDTTDTSPARLAKSTVAELKALCKAKGFKCSGKKEELVERLTAGAQTETKNAGPSAKASAVPTGKAPGKVIAKTSAKIASKPDVISKLTANVPVIPIRRNKFNNYEHPETGFVFDTRNERVVGKQQDDGSVADLTDEDIEKCKKFKFVYDIPSNLDTNTGLDKVKISGIEDDEDIPVEEDEDEDDSDVPVEEDEEDEDVIEEEDD